MNKIIRIAIVGAPNTGKTKLINEVRDRLKKDYNILIAPNPMSYLVESGLNPTYNISNIDFQLESLDRHIDNHYSIEYTLDRYLLDKPTVIFYESIPKLERTFLSIHNQKDLKKWDDMYEEDHELFESYNFDKVFVMEIAKGEYNHKGIANSFDLQRALTVEERIIQTCKTEYNDYKIISNNYSLDDKVDLIIDYIESVFNSVKSAKICLYQGCSNPTCNWSDCIDINNLYKYCPMCGQLLINYSRSNKDKDPFNSEEALRKMFYVDYTKLPKYVNTSYYN